MALYMNAHSSHTMLSCISFIRLYSSPCTLLPTTTAGAGSDDRVAQGAPRGQPGALRHTGGGEGRAGEGGGRAEQLEGRLRGGTWSAGDEQEPGM